MYNKTVAVGSDIWKPFTHALALGFNRRVPTEGSSKRLFCFYVSRQGALADGLHGLNPRNTDNRTHPLFCRLALIERLVKHLVHGGNKAKCISESIRQAHLGFKSFKSGAGRLEVTSIHPWRTYGQTTSTRNT
jgi:hypothetical protein